MLRTLEKVNDSNNIADDINTELIKQIEQLTNATNMVKDTKTDIQRANEYIRFFAAEVKKDKFLMIMISLVILVILTIVVIKVLGVHVGGGAAQQSFPNADIIIKSLNQ